MPLQDQLLALRTADVDARFDVVDALLRSWFDLSPQRGASGNGREMPDVLREFHARFGAVLPDAAWQNRLLAADALVPKDGKLVFAEENQAVYSWAVAPEQANVSVWGRFDYEEPWDAEEPELSLFLVQFVLFEAILAAPHGAASACLGQAEADRLLAECTEVPFGAWRWPLSPSRFLVRGDALVFVCPNDGDAFSVWVSALDASSVAFVRPHVTAAWEDVRLGATQ